MDTLPNIHPGEVLRDHGEAIAQIHALAAIAGVGDQAVEGEVFDIHATNPSRRRAET